MIRIARAALAALLLFGLAAIAAAQQQPRVLTAKTVCDALGYCPGQGTWYSVARAPASSEGQTGDLWLRTDTGQIYKKGASTWSVAMSIPAPGGNNSWTGFNIWKGFGETYVAASITAGTLAIDLTQGTVFTVTSNANISTYTISGAPAGKATSFTLVLTSDGNSYTQAWGASVKWADGIAPSLTATAGKIDVLTFITFDAGTTWLGFVAGYNF